MSTATDLQKFVAAGQAAQTAVDESIAQAKQTGMDRALDQSVGRVRESVNPTPLLNRQACRELFLDTAKRERPFNKFSRVSEDTLIAANAMLRQWIVQRVKSSPSKGVTL